MKIKNNSIKYNYFMNCILTVSAFVFPLVTFPYATRILTPAYLGKVTYATSIISYFVMFSNLGIPTYGIRVCAGLKDDKEKLSRCVSEIMTINFFTCILSYLLLFGLIVISDSIAAYKELLYIISLTIVFNFIGIDWMYRGLEQFEYITKRSVIFKLISVVGVFVFVHSEKDYIIYAILTIVASVGSNVLNFINAKKIISIKFYKGMNIKQHLKPILVFFSMSVATQIYTNLDSVMLGWMKGDAEVAFYGAAVKVKSVLFSVVTSLSTVLLPKASQYIKEGKISDFIQISKKSIEFVVLISLPLVVFFVFFAKSSILILCGEEYLDAVPAMQIIMPTVFLIGLSSITGIQMLVPLKLEKGVLFSEIIGAIIDLGINIILIPTLGAAGASIGTLIAEICVLFVQIIWLKKKNINIMFEIEWWKYLCAAIGFSVVMILCIKLIHYNLFLDFFASGFIATMIYLTVLYICKAKMFIYILDTLRNALKSIRRK